MFLLLACAPEPPEPASHPADPTTTFWHGGSLGHDPDKVSTEVPDDLWVSRTLDPAAGTIEERILLEGRWTTTYQVSNDHFDGEQPTIDGTLLVTGTLQGAPWEWQAWGSAATYLDGDYAGMFLKSEDEVAPDGRLRSQKLVYVGFDDDPVWAIDEVSEVVSADVWAAAWEAAFRPLRWIQPRTR